MLGNVARKRKETGVAVAEREKATGGTVGKSGRRLGENRTKIGFVGKGLKSVPEYCKAQTTAQTNGEEQTC